MIKPLMILLVALAAPIATRPTPDTIKVEGAHWSGVMRDEAHVIHGHHFHHYAWRDDDGSTVFRVDPFKDYTIQAYTREIINEIDNGEHIDERYELSVLSTTEDKLDWIMYQRIWWEIRFNTLIEQEQLNNFDLSASRARVLGWADIDEIKDSFGRDAEGLSNE